MKYIYGLTSLLFILGASGCSSESTTSDIVATEKIWADIRLTANGKRARVVTEFNKSSSIGANIILSPSDKVQATVGNEVKVLEMDEDILDIDYQGYFSQTTKNTEFKLELIRSKENKTLTSKVLLPEEVLLYSPVASTYRKDSRIVVEWKPVNEPNTTLTLFFNASCTTNTGDPSSISRYVELDDSDGSYTILLGSIEGLHKDNLNKKKSCKSHITLSRSKKGTVDSQFKSGSSIHAIQEKESEELTILLN
ncbi:MULTISPECIES: hypothetical protein [Pseudoalteromonas]|uniref:hypothetical protein n=1 Tax=Pseudoalteromonas TaxID=53246 RepID=UPI000FFEA344|nr:MULTISPECIES: hypothetical protein [Pseudoalteromonas]MCG9760304.1 hypothetical protein [Pseudoalteromonas sp. Isolate6]NKC21670.1 hypothetical protein [Pseudoalteromonas galatheae]RXE88270.1 hypothetical protein DRB05_03850 [Pseudoalteromonas sp. A757]